MKTRFAVALLFRRVLRRLGISARPVDMKKIDEAMAAAPKDEHGAGWR